MFGKHFDSRQSISMCLRLFGKKHMAKAKKSIDVTDAEIEAAIANGKVYDQYAPRAAKAAYREDSNTIAITLSTGVEVAIPRRLLQGLKAAPVADVAKVTIVGPGSTLFWETLDEAHGIEHLLRGVFGNRRWMQLLSKC
jgi:hypothetical protein